MNHLDELIKRAIQTKALPLVEVETFAEKVGKTTEFREILETGELKNNPEAVAIVERLNLIDELIAAALEDGGA